MRGSIPIHAGSGPGLSQRRLGSKSGSEKLTLTVNQMPAHTHGMKGSIDSGSAASPSNATVGRTTNFDFDRASGSPGANMSSIAISSVGGSQSHTNLQPFLCIYFIIALFGIYPSRN